MTIDTGDGPAWEVVAQAPPRETFRALYDALIEARGYVVRASKARHGAALASRAHEADELLERIDGALADGAEVLS